MCPVVSHYWCDCVSLCVHVFGGHVGAISGGVVAVVVVVGDLVVVVCGVDGVLLVVDYVLLFLRLFQNSLS